MANVKISIISNINDINNVANINVCGALRRNLAIWQLAAYCNENNGNMYPVSANAATMAIRLASANQMSLACQRGSMTYNLIISVCVALCVQLCGLAAQPVSCTAVS